MTVLELRKMLFAIPKEQQSHKVVAFVEVEGRFADAYPLTGECFLRGTDEIALGADDGKADQDFEDEEEFALKGNP